jgi:hypothetical protein
MSFNCKPLLWFWILFFFKAGPLLARAGGSCDTITGTCYCLPKVVKTVASIESRIQRGMDIFAEKYVMFGLPLIDPIALLEPNDRLTPLITYIQRLGQLFEDYRIVVPMNGWSDQGVFINEELNLLCSNLRITCFRNSMKLNPSMAADEAGIGALLSNTILNHVRDMLVVDELLMKMDLVLLDPNLWAPTSANAPVVGIAEALAVTMSELEIKNYDVICGNQIKGSRADLVSDAPFDSLEAGISLQPVLSCFGGIALYNLDAIFETGCRFHVKLSTGHSQENVHFVSLNACLVTHGRDRLYVNPAAFVLPDASQWKCKRFAKLIS